jgi:hypothetical protein
MLKAVAEVVKIEKASWRFDQFVPGGILFRSYAAFFSFSANRSIASSNLPDYPVALVRLLGSASTLPFPRDCASCGDCVKQPSYQNQNTNRLRISKQTVWVMKAGRKKIPNREARRT